MVAAEYRRSVCLSSAEYVDVLSRLITNDESSPQTAAEWNGAGERFEFRKPDVKVCIEHPSGGFGRYLAYGTFLSARQIALVHGGYLHVDSRCTVRLPVVGGGEDAVEGEVKVCRHVQGSLHEVLVRFDTGIDPRRHIRFNDGSDGDDGDEINPLDLTGRVLLLDDQEAECRLMAHYLSSTRLDLRMFIQAAAALDELKNQPFDIVICDLNLGENVKGESVISTMVNDAGYQGLIVALSGDMSPARVAEAKAAGACSVLKKPYTQRALMSTLADCLNEAGLGPNEDPILSDRRKQPGMDELVDWYVGQAKTMLHAIKKGIEVNALAEVRSQCEVLRETGAGYGYELLSESASDAITALDASCSVEESLSQLKKLELIIRRMR